MCQNSTAGYPQAVPLMVPPGKTPCLPCCPDTGSVRFATSHLPGENPTSQSRPGGMHPGTGCNNPSPRVQNGVRSDVARSGNDGPSRRRPATSQDRFGPVTVCLPHSDKAFRLDGCERARGFHLPAQPPASLPAPSGNMPQALRKCSRREDSAAPPFFSLQSRTTPPAHTPLCVCQNG